MNTFVVSDIHGRLDLLEACISKIESQAKSGRIIFTGDFIDRGPQSCQVVQRLIAGPSSDSWVWDFIRGNHEDMMIDADADGDRNLWLMNGGVQTVQSYGFADATFEDHLEWMNRLPRLIEDDLRVYTHAGVDETYDISDQPEQVTQWFRYPEGANVGYRGKHVVHGHTPKPYGPELYENRTNLDVGGVFTGRMAIGVFNDAQAGPVDILEVLGNDFEFPESN